MKKIFTLLFLVMLSVHGMAEVMNFKATDYAQRDYKSSGWTAWSEWESSGNFFVFDSDKELITRYAGTTQYTYNILDSDDLYDEDGDHWISFDCVDGDGDRCRVQFLLPQDNDRNMQLYVRFEGLVEMVWNIEPR